MCATPVPTPEQSQLSPFSLRTPSLQAVDGDSDLSACLCQVVSLCEVFLGHRAAAAFHPLRAVSLDETLQRA